MNWPIRLLSTDFDGTIFSEFERPPIPEELVALIADLQAAGGKWVVNTGRDMSSLMEALGRSGIEVEPDYLVLVEREIHRHQDSRYVPVQDWNTRCEHVHAKLFGKIRPLLPAIVAWINARFHARLYEDAYSPLCVIAGTNGDMDHIHHHLDEFCAQWPGLVVVRNDVYARFSHADFNKGTALAEITRQLGLTAAEVMAAGDHLNDLPMLQTRFAHHLAAPANAVPTVREALRREGGYLAQAPQGRGVAEAIKYYRAAARG